MQAIKKYLKFFIPFLLYIGVTPLLGLFIENPEYAGYIIKTFLVTSALIYYWKQYNIKFRFDITSVIVGILIFIIWVGPELFLRLPGWYFIGDLSSFNPFLLDPDKFLIIFILIVRVFGAVIAAPLVEELFVRSFLIRYLIDEDFESVRIGAYTLISFTVTVLFFGLSHQRWIPGLITGIILNLLLYWKKDISSCIIAHSSANAFLAAYVILTNSWFFW